MGWYNTGAWEGLDGTEIPYVFAELANAVNERRDCLGKSRYMWTVNTGTEASPSLSTKSTNLTASDFFGLDMNKFDFLAVVMARVSELLTPVGGYDSATRHSGFAIESDNSGLAANDDLWTAATVLADAGMSVGGVDSALWSYRAEYCREALDRMIYPVIYPELTAIDGLLLYKSEDGTIDPDIESDLDQQWDKARGYPAFFFGLFGYYPTATGCLARVRGFERFVTGGGYIPRYVVRIEAGATYTISNLGNQSGTGYIGTITKQWCSVTAGRDENVVGSADVGTDSTMINLAFLGASVPIEAGMADFSLPTSIPLDGDIDSDFSIPSMPTTSSPFGGTEVSPHGLTIGDVGGVSVSPRIKFESVGSPSVQSGFNHLRQIIDISGELTDQA